MNRIPLFVSQALLLVASNSNADVLITGRSSLLSTNIDFGYVGSVLTSTDSAVNTTIDDTQLTRQGAAMDGGPLGDVSWDASYQFQLDQQLVPNPPIGVSGSSSTNLFAFAGGEGVCYLASTNRLEVLFENSTPTVFDLVFNATAYSRLDLDQMTTPGMWDNVSTIPGGLGEVLTTVKLGTGVFRLTAVTNVSTDNGFSIGASWFFSIAAVPEPSSIGLLAISSPWLIIGARRWRFNLPA